MRLPPLVLRRRVDCLLRRVWLVSFCCKHEWHKGACKIMRREIGHEILDMDLEEVEKRHIGFLMLHLELRWR